MCEPGGANNEDANLWWLGVMMSIVASILSNLGVNIQKFSMMKEQVREESKRRGYWCQPYYFTGFLMIVFGSLGDFAALGFAAQSLITPVGGVTMVANVFFAHFWLKEALNKKDLLGTSSVLLGILLIAIFADKKESCYTLPQLIELYEEPVFLVYAALMVLASGALYAFVKYCEHLYKAPGKWGKYLKVKKYHQFIYPTLSGVLGAQSVLFAKSTAELLKSTFNGDNQLIYFVTYLILAGMFCCILFQLHFLAMGLKWFDAVYVIPVFQCFFITVTILGGAVYFKEFSEFTAVQAVFFSLGVLITLGGIVLLSKRRMAEHGHPSMKGVAMAVLFSVRLRRIMDAHKAEGLKVDIEQRRSDKRATSQRLEAVKQQQMDEGRYEEDNAPDWRAGGRKWPLRHASKRSVDSAKKPAKPKSKFAAFCQKLKPGRKKAGDRHVSLTDSTVGNDPEAVILARRESASRGAGKEIEMTAKAPRMKGEFSALDGDIESKGFPRRKSRSFSGEVVEAEAMLPGETREPALRAIVQPDSDDGELESQAPFGSSARVPIAMKPHSNHRRQHSETTPLTSEPGNGSGNDDSSSGDSPSARGPSERSDATLVPALSSNSGRTSRSTGDLPGMDGAASDTYETNSDSGPTSRGLRVKKMIGSRTDVLPPLHASQSSESEAKPVPSGDALSKPPSYPSFPLAVTTTPIGGARAAASLQLASPSHLPSSSSNKDDNFL